MSTIFKPIYISSSFPPSSSNNYYSNQKNHTIQNTHHQTISNSNIKTKRMGKELYILIQKSKE